MTEPQKAINKKIIGIALIALLLSVYSMSALSFIGGNITVYNNYTNITNGSGGVSFNGSAVDGNGSSLYNFTNQAGTFNHSNLTNLSYDYSGHIGFVGTTAGQTFSVSTSAEMTSVLLNLSLHPSLSGNIIINVTANITGNFVIPTLLYNGFELTIQGSLIEIMSDTATGGADQVNGVSKGYYEKTTASYTPNVYRGKLMKNPSGHYVAIDSNSATRIYYSALGGASPSFQKFSNGETVKIYDWAYSVTGNTYTMPVFLNSEYAKVTIKNIKIINSQADTAIRTLDYSKIKIRNSRIQSDDGHVFGAINANPGSSVNSLASVFSGGQAIIRLESGSLYYSRDVFGLEHMGGNVFILVTAPVGYKTGLYLNQLSRANSFYDTFYSVDLKPTGSKAIWILDNADALMVLGFVDSFETGVLAQYPGFARNAAMLYTNYTTLYTPVSTDPSFIS